MPTNSSTSSSETASATQDLRRFVRRLTLFLSPLIATGLLVVGLAVSSGEFMPAGAAAWAQTLGTPVLFLPKYSDHNFAYKAAATKFRHPDILILGASRSNQWRSAMFPGQSFYNASQAVYTFKDYSTFLRNLGDHPPRVVIASIDFYNFDPVWNSGRDGLSQSDLQLLDTNSWPPLASSLLSAVTTDRALFASVLDPLYRVPALGFSARKVGAGFRNDGSFQYGLEISGDFSGSVTIHSAMQRVTDGASPFGYGDGLDSSALDDLQQFLALAKSKGIQVIGVTMPFHPALVAALAKSPRHERWRQFRGSELRRWLNGRGVPYFDFTDIDSIGGLSDEFIDPFHASEPAFLRALVRMGSNPEVRQLLQINAAELSSHLGQATNLEVFRNAF